MNDKLFSAVHTLATLGRSREPMTEYQLEGGTDDATVLPLLLDAGYVSQDGDGHYGLNCDPDELNLFELKKIFDPYECKEEMSFAGLFVERLKEITVGWMMELEKPKPTTRKDIDMFEDCLQKIERETGEKLRDR
jgi:hypothetical protein